MTDEEYGRAWAGQQGCAPILLVERYAWTCYGRGPFRIPRLLYTEVCQQAGVVQGELTVSSLTEADAYAALGRAVRAVHAAVPVLREPPSGQPAGG